jgi:predicted metalloprotease
MDWEGREESENVEDRRGLGKKAGLAIGGVGGVVVLILALILGINPQQLLGPGGPVPPGGPGGQPEGRADPAEQRMASFTKVVFHDTEVVWDDLFQKMGKRYEKPVLVLYTGQVDSACGAADAAVGPFYCPGDSRVYIDLSFYKDMERKLNAPGEFARAYVIAHEVGHHVQRLLGYSARVDRARRTASKTEANHMSVRLELQADYLAGVWAHHADEQFHFLEQGDIESALHAAFEIGDDRLQKKARGYVVPDAFTHGTSEQRARWFRDGFKTGDVDRARLLFEVDYKKL